MRTWLGLVAAGLLAVAFAPSASAAPKVVVTLKPLHSLVAAVMEGVGTPTLLLQGATTPHVYSLRPSDARALADADIVVWAGPDLETFLEKPVQTVARRALKIALAEDAGLRLLPLRETGLSAADHHRTGGRDMHFWLDVANARQVVTYVAAVLIDQDPANARAYRANAARTLDLLKELDRELTDTLRPISEQPFLVLHDAFQYLEAAYGLRSLGILTVNPDRVPGAKTLITLRAAISEAQVRCIFSEPQFPAALARTAGEGRGATLVAGDILGAGLDPGPGAYGAMMRGLAQAFRNCLSASA